MGNVRKGTIPPPPPLQTYKNSAIEICEVCNSSECGVVFSLQRGIETIIFIEKKDEARQVMSKQPPEKAKEVNHMNSLICYKDRLLNSIDVCEKTLIWNM